MRIDQNTTFRLPASPAADRSVVDFLRGAIHFLSREPRSIDVRTPFVTAGIEGTEFLVVVRADYAEIIVFDGRVVAANEKGTITLSRNQSAVARAGQAPQLRVIVRPQDAVQWALYYPPILLLSDVEIAGAEFNRALHSWNSGDLASAFAELDAVAAPNRNDLFHLYRAGLLLTVGRLDEARHELAAIASDPSIKAAKFGLLSVIAVARNDIAEGLANGRKAVSFDTNSSAARIALSYALQANFELEAALDVIEEGLQARPDNALSWTRAAELLLALGQSRKAIKAAENAAQLAPNLAPTQAVLGFAALARAQIDNAKSTFDKAITLDSADPLPRFGLGLAKIRAGDLESGREDIEIAATLDPNNALIRSYLGKAYFEENRPELAEEQFDIAKALDPKDPTPWLYDAIRKQTENRPVEALRDLQKSIELNDNRAVYRSRLLLDEDLATRGAALARIYDDLNFEQRAIVESAKSLTINPTDHSAHRFLSDSYADRPRHEIARASELLQAQLLQPINIDPVQPQLSQTDLNIIAGAGPADIALNEFTPVFQSDGLRLDISGFGGNNNTWGDEAVLSGIFNNVSFSVGQYHYESDGFRVNNDAEHDIYDAFVQVAVTDKLGVQFEYRGRRTEQGDLRLNFDPDDFHPFERRNIKEDIYRVGAHYALDPGSDLIASFIYGEGSERINDIDEFGIIFDSDGSDRSYDGQARYILNSEQFNFSAGFSASDVDVDLRNSIDFTAIFGVPCPIFIGVCDSFPDVSAQQHNVYAYSDLTLPGNVVATAGLSYDSFERSAIDVDRVNPKFGLQWDVNENARLRLAYFKTVKRALIADQTLEPTHVAGFNQFFDDVDGTRTERYGGALDLTFTESLYGGVEVSRRNLEVPTLVLVEPPEVITEDQREDLYRAYLYWAPHPEWAMTGEVQYEIIERDDVAGFLLPTFVKTLSVPLGVKYFNPSGFFAEAGVTYVHQKVGLPPGSTFDQDEDDFVLVDVAVGYRLPNRRGLLAIEARNLLNEHFLFQDPNIQAQEPSNPVYIPERSVLARFTMNF